MHHWPLAHLQSLHRPQLFPGNLFSCSGGRVAAKWGPCCHFGGGQSLHQRETGRLEARDILLLPRERAVDGGLRIPGCFCLAAASAGFSFQGTSVPPWVVRLDPESGRGPQGARCLFSCFHCIVLRLERHFCLESQSWHRQKCNFKLK